jgi:hypothetical protein
LVTRGVIACGEFALPQALLDKNLSISSLISN